MNKETLDILNREYKFLTGRDMSDEEILMVRALANDVGNDEQKLTEFVITRARIIADNAKTKVLMDLSSKIENQLKIMMTAEIDGYLKQIKETMEEARSAVEMICTQEVLKFEINNTKVDVPELHQMLVTFVNEKVITEVTKTKKYRAWIYFLVGSIVGGVITWAAWHPSTVMKLINFF